MPRLNSCVQINKSSPQIQQLRRIGSGIRNSYTEREARGFTLLELLISTAGGLLIFLAVLQMFSAARTAYNTTGPRAETVQNTRIALERMSRDLRQAEDLVTALPETDTDSANPPPSEIEFQDGHDSSALTYLRYYLEDDLLYLEESYYAFESSPSVRVRFNAQDSFGNSPTKYAINDQIIAEGFTALGFFGDEIITVEILAEAATDTITMRTAVFGRNL